MVERNATTLLGPYIRSKVGTNMVTILLTYCIVQSPS